MEGVATVTALIVTLSILGYLAGWMICVRIVFRIYEFRNEDDRLKGALQCFGWPIIGLGAALYGLFRIATLPPKRERVQAKIDRLTEDINRLADGQDR